MGTALGRPTKYNTEIAEKFCTLLSTSDASVADICAMPDMPDRATIFRWFNTHKDFCDLYARAREIQTEHGYDEMKDIADAPLPTVAVHNLLSGEYEGEKVDAGVAMAEMQKRKLQIDVIKFKLVKLQPKRFGDNRNVAVDVKVQHQVTPDQFQKLLATAAAAPQIEDAEVLDDEAQGLLDIPDTTDEPEDEDDDMSYL